MTKRISVRIDGSDVIVYALDYLGDTFRSYNEACRLHGMVWNKECYPKSRNIGSIVGLIGLVQELVSRDFAIDSDDAVKAAIEVTVEGGLTAEEEKAIEHYDRHAEEIASRGLVPYPYQRDGVLWLHARRFALLGDKMGLGKTWQALLALPTNGTSMVVCPSSVKPSFAYDAHRLRPDLTVTMFISNPTKKGVLYFKERGINVDQIRRLPKKGEIYITNYESTPCAALVYKPIPKYRGEKVRTFKKRFDSPDAQTAWLTENEVNQTCLQTTFLPAVEGAVLIGDEIHRTKNTKAKQTLRWQTLRDLFVKNNGSVWGMSGTPMFNRPFDLMNVLRNLNLFNDAFSGYSDFLSRMGGSKGRFGVMWSGEVDPSVAQSMRRVMLRREPQDVLTDLPSVRYRDVDVECSDKMQKMLDVFASDLTKSGIDMNGITKELDRSMELINAAKAAFSQASVDDPLDEKISNRILEMESHLQGWVRSRLDSISTVIDFKTMSTVRKALAEATLPAVMDRIEDYEEEGEAPVIFSAHRGPIEALAKRTGWVSILGGTSTEDRGRAIDEHQRGATSGIGLTIGAGKEGITLTRSAHLDFIDLSWNPSDNEQAEHRIIRIGQKRPVLITRYVVSHPIVERIHELLTWKQKMHNDAISAASIRTSLSESRSEEAQAALQSLQGAQEAADVAKVEQEAYEAERAAQRAVWAEKRRIRDEKRQIRDEENARKIRLRFGHDENGNAIEKHAPQDDAERWVVRSVVSLTAQDGDHATELNGIGFNKADSYYGHEMANVITLHGGLTDEQYKHAARMLAKYHSQIGSRPGRVGCLCSMSKGEWCEICDPD